MAQDALELIKQQLQNTDIKPEELTIIPKKEAKVEEPEPKIEIQEFREEKRVEKKVEKKVEEKKEVKKEVPKKTKKKKITEKPKMKNKKPKRKIVKIVKKTSKKPGKKKNKIDMKKYIIPAAVIVGIVIILLILKFTVFNNKGTVVAYVNSEPIYLSEINERFDLYQGVYSKEELLNQSVMEILLLQEADKQGISVTDKEFDDLLQEIYLSTGTTKDDLINELNTVGISYEEYKESSMKTMTIRKLLDVVLVGITVTEQETRDYYNSVKELLDENVTYADVKELINQTIFLDKRDVMFQDYLSGLMDKAEITLFNEYITEGSEEADKKIELAKCLTANNVKIYSSTTCSACLTQKNMFGDDAVEFLDVVNCSSDEGKQECIDMAIKATPTWIINGVKYTGVLALETLAESAGCEY